MNPNAKKILSYILIALPIVLIATCNYYVNTNQENQIIEDPKPGDYFVFRGLISDFDQPFKLKEITKEDYVFYVPQYELLSFDMHKSPSKVYELEEKGQMYNGMTIAIKKETVGQLIQNSELAVRIQDHPNVYLKGVFGKHRPNKVEEFLEKIVPESNKK